LNKSLRKLTEEQEL